LEVVEVMEVQEVGGGDLHNLRDLDNLQNLAFRGRQASTGLVRLSLRAQVLSVLVNPAGKTQKPTLNWLWLRKLRLHAPA